MIVNTSIAVTQLILSSFDEAQTVTFLKTLPIETSKWKTANKILNPSFQKVAINTVLPVLVQKVKTSNLGTNQYVIDSADLT